MTAHRTLPAMAPLHASRAAIAACAVQHQAPSSGPPTTRVLSFFDRTANISMWFARHMLHFPRTSHPVLAQALNANAVQTEEITVIFPWEPLMLPAWARLTIACDAGTVWITQGDGGDYVLRAGQSFTLAPRDKVIILAMFGSAVVRRIAEPLRIKGQG